MTAAEDEDAHHSFVVYFGTDTDFLAISLVPGGHSKSMRSHP